MSSYISFPFLHHSSHMHRVSLSVVHILVLAPDLDLDVTLFRKDEVQILERLCKPEALHVVKVAAAIRLGNVAHASIGGTSLGYFLHVPKGFPCHILVLAIAGDTVSVVYALDGLGTQDVRGRGDPETGLVVEPGLVGGRLLAVGLGGVDPAEALGANAGGCLLVGLVVGVGELDTVVNVLLLVEEDTAKDEVAASK